MWSSFKPATSLQNCLFLQAKIHPKKQHLQVKYPRTQAKLMEIPGQKYMQSANRGIHGQNKKLHPYRTIYKAMSEKK